MGRTEKLANFARLLIRDMKHTHVYGRGKRLTILDDPAHLSPKPSHAPVAMFPTGERKGMLVISRFMRARLENETDNNVTLRSRSARETPRIADVLLSCKLVYEARL